MSTSQAVRPVPPQFAEILAETAHQTAIEYLQRIEAPKPLIDLINGIYALDFYIMDCYKNPAEEMNGHDIENFTIETIQAIVACGGTFRGPLSDSQPIEIKKSA